MRRPFLCRLGLHRFPRFVDVRSQAPAPVRCDRCTAPYGGEIPRRRPDDDSITRRLS